MTNLFSQAVIKGHIIKNRVVMPPMVCFGWSDGSGYVTDNHVKHYEECAKGGTGLIIVEAACIDKDGRLAPSQLGIWSDEYIEGLSRIAAACHKHGAKVLIQIHHAGYSTPDSVSLDHLCPSDYDNGKRHGRAMTIDEIKSVQMEFTNAAKRAERAGFDGIELHGAHGYLIDQFNSPIVNKRNDKYGGSFQNRANFACEIIKMIKSQASENFIIGYRMGGNEPTLENGIQVAKILEACGADILHVSSGIYEDEHPSAPAGSEYNWIVFCGIEIKKHVKVPVIAVNEIRTPERAAYLIENGMADFTAIGRGHLADPEWANKAEHNIEVTSCLKCKRCWWFTDGSKCPRHQ